MIFVTGDVHDMAMGGPDQRCLRERGALTEMDCAVKFAELAASHEVSVTFFITGKAAQDEPAALAQLMANPWVDVGGHTWNGLQPTWRHLVRERLQGSYYGSPRVQQDDIAQTLETISQETGAQPLTWRTHAYRGDATTNRILDRFGCQVVSDTVGPQHRIEKIGISLWSLPINTPPDHEHLYHGRFTPEWHAQDHQLRRSPWHVVTRRGQDPDWGRAVKEIGKRAFGIHTPVKPFGDVFKEADDWWGWVWTELTYRLDEVGFATLLLHPACMEVLDGMASVDRFLSEIRQMPCRFVSQAQGSLDD